MDSQRLDLLLDLRRYRDAESCARELIAQNINWAEGYTQLARALLGQNRFPDALEAAKEGVRQDPQSPFSQAVLGFAFYQLGNDKTAMEHVMEALRLLPTYTWAYYIASKIDERSGRYRDVLKWCRDGLQHDPQYELLLHQRGWALKCLNQRQDALKEAEEALRVHPQSACLMHLKACALYEEASTRSAPAWKLHRQADAAFQEAIRLNPSEDAYRDNAVMNQKMARNRMLHVPLITLAVLWFIVMAKMAGEKSLNLPQDRQAPGNPAVMWWNGLLVAGLAWFIAMILTPLHEHAYALVPSRFTRLAPMPPRNGPFGKCLWLTGAMLLTGTALFAFLA